jgi:MHS family alpha-ketoglutarate permease-like MFS transporter
VTEQVEQHVRRPVRQLVAASIGNAVEWYDWYAYTFLAVYFSGQIFPGDADDRVVPLLSAFAVFAPRSRSAAPRRRPRRARPR